MATFRVLIALIATLLGLILALPIVAISLIFWAIASLTRSISNRLEGHVVSWQQLIEFDPYVGWKPKANMDTHALAQDVFHLKTDSHGWRGKTTIPESDVVVFGDSHAFGYGMDEKRLFTELNPQLRVKAIGVNGYNMVQGLLWMDALKFQLENKLVVWFIFLGNDLYDNLEPSLHHYRIPFVRQANGMTEWEIVTTHISPAHWPYTSRRFMRTDYDRLIKIYSPNVVADRAFSACDFLIRRAKDTCNHASASLSVMTIPDPLPLHQRGVEQLVLHGADPKLFDPDFPDRRIADICASLGVPCEAGKEYLDVGHYQEHDDHWNAAGHLKVSEALRDLYCRHMLRDHGT